MSLYIAKKCRCFNMRSLKILVVIVFSLQSLVCVANDDYYIEDGERVELLAVTEPESKLRVLSSVRFYQKRSGSIVGIGQGFFVELSASADISEFQKRYSVELVRHVVGKTYHFNANNQDVLQLLKLFYNDDAVVAAYPDLLKKANKR